MRRLLDLEERVSALDEVGDLSAEPGSRPWAVAVRDELRACVNDTKSTAEHLQSWRDAMVRYGGWRQLEDHQGRRFNSFRTFCEARPPFGLGYPPEFIEALICKKTADEWAEDHGELREHRRPTNEELALKVTNGNFIEKKGGNRAGYLTGRIARDRPDILERMRAGEFSSVREAALEAGIVKPCVQVELTADGFRRAIRRHLDRDQIASLVAGLREA